MESLKIKENVGRQLYADLCEIAPGKQKAAPVPRRAA